VVTWTAFGGLWSPLELVASPWNQKNSRKIWLNCDL
jgi:hypothetical protein